jgi:hypothetical protein
LQWRFSALVEAGSSKRLVEASYIETRQMQAALKMQINKTAGMIAKMHNPIGVSSMKKLVGPSDTNVCRFGAEEGLAVAQNANDTTVYMVNVDRSGIHSSADAAARVGGLSC